MGARRHSGKHMHVLEEARLFHGDCTIGRYDFTDIGQIDLFIQRLSIDCLFDEDFGTFDRDCLLALSRYSPSISEEATDLATAMRCALRPQNDGSYMVYKRLNESKHDHEMPLP